MTSAVSAGGLYRWTDENGKVHYSDSVPPSQAQGGHSELDELGNHVDKVAPAKSDDEVAEDKWLDELEDQLKVKRQQQLRNDNLLLNSYSSVEQFDELHAERIKVLDDEHAQLKLLRGKLEDEFERLEKQLKDSNNAGSKKRVQEFIDTNRSNSEAYDQAIEQNRKEAAALQLVAEEQRKRLVYLLSKADEEKEKKSATKQ
ncbi:MAG: DUF4124 domain-containing protein [Thiolinea sp.]